MSFETRRCETCDCIIPKERLEVLPGTKTCVKHSKEQAYQGVMVFDHKTAPSLVKAKPSDEGNEEKLRRMWRAYHRAR